MQSSRTIPVLITIDELAEQLGITVRHVRRLVAERRIPFIKVGWFIRFDTEEISRWLDDSPREPLSESGVPATPTQAVASLNRRTGRDEPRGGVT